MKNKNYIIFSIFSIFSIFKSKFTLKIVLLTILPVLFISVFSILILVHKINELNSNTTEISANTLNTIYTQIITDKNNDIKEKVLLRIDSVLNEVNVLRAGAQQLIDKNEVDSLDKNFEYDSWVRNNMVYNSEKNWSNLSQNEFNISMSIWGYLHNKDGSINQKTKNYITLMSPLKMLMQTIGENGTDKGWFYVTGPKEAPVMIMTPWAQMPEIFDKEYPGHNENNWWDFFFPGMIESWEKWIPSTNNVSNKMNNQVTLTPLYEDAGGTGLMVTIFEPLWNKSRTKNFGAAAVDYNMNNITKMVKDEHLGENGFTFLVQSEGNILDATEDITRKLEISQNKNIESGVEVSYFNLKESKIEELSVIVENFKNMDKSQITEFTDNKGEKFILGFEKLMDYNLWDNNKINSDKLYIVSIIPREEVFKFQSKIHDEITKSSNQTLLFLIIVSLLFAFISILCTVWYALQNTKQIRVISQGLSQVGKKNFNSSIDIISKDELGNLAKTFNYMTGEISEAYNKLENYALELEQKVKERTSHLEEANQKLEQLSNIDGLTKIHNRRYFDTMLEKIWNEYSRLNHPISIILIDIDNFKKYNDNYGHQEGDSCLCSVASILQEQLNRSSDIIARYGGEEFVVIACVDMNNAFKLAEKMRLAVKSLAIEHKLSEKNIVSISLGVTSVIPSPNKEINKLIKAADIALYESKENGRDMVRMKEY